MARQIRTDLARSRGWEARKTPVTGIVFLLDFLLYRTYQDLALGVGRLLCATTRCNNNIQVSKLTRMSAVKALCFRKSVSGPGPKLREFLKRVFGPRNEPRLVPTNQ